jgi:predicted MFS family arabinose efflux permease
MTAGGGLQLGRTAAIVAAMLGCGFAAGRWGKRRVFGWAVLCMGLGMGLCALAPSYGVLFLALVVAGSGEGVVEGLATPFVENLHRDEPGRYINFTHAFWSVGVFATVLAAGALLTLGVSWRLITAGVALLTLVPATLLLTVFPGASVYPEHPEPLHWTHVRDQALEIMARPRFWLFFAAMFVAGGGEFCLTFWSASHIQLHFGAAAWAGGGGTACFAAGMMVGRTGWGYLIRQHQLRRLLLGSGAIGALVTLFLPVADSLVLFFALLFVAGLATAPFWPSIQSHCVDRLEGTDTTMLFVLLSCAGVPGCGFFTWVMGVLADHGPGLGAAFWLVPGCFLVLTLLIALDRNGRPRDGTGGPALG